MRFLTDDIRELRGRYLFYLAHLCHVSPREVDTMRVGDFAALVCGIDQYLEANRSNG